MVAALNGVAASERDGKSGCSVMYLRGAAAVAARVWRVARGALHLTMKWVVSFSISRPFGRRRDTRLPAV